ncbi:PK beta-barrel-protein domain-containing protein-like protein [Xylariaceae sp. FL0016]|nr:PK beta-barrel-protein domain-containing protein-like protein [Xylariaceae sp. FL0016]
MGSPIFGSNTGHGLTPTPPKDRLLSLRTGKIRPFAGVKINSAINKQVREGKVLLSKYGFTGDERSYFMHQNPDNAVHQYDARHYASWAGDLPDRAHKFKAGAFGENITTNHLSESNVCIGDKFRLGPEAIIQVTMPRQPCFKLNHRFEYRKMSSAAQNTGRTGWLYRVLQPGYVQEGDEMELMERINPDWPLSRVQHHLYKDRNNMEMLAELVQLEGLSQEFVTLFQKRLVSGAEDMNQRLNGDVAMPWRSYKVAEKMPLTPRAQKFVLTAEDCNIEPDQLPFGRFSHVRVKFGPESRFTRAYSVVSGDMSSFELGIAKDDNSRGGSAYLHDNVKVGDVIKVAKGHSAPVAKETMPQLLSKRHVFIIGGIGVTAYLAEIKALANMSAHFEVHYATRSRQEAAYLDQLPHDKTQIYAKDEGQRVRVSDIIPTPTNTLDPEAMIYCCGPTTLLNDCQSVIQKLKYPKSHFHYEEFGGAATGTGNPFEAEIKSTGAILQVPSEKSLLQVLNDAGFDIDSSCLVGNCGSCMVDLCKGDVTHQGVALDDEKKKTTMLSCVSRGKERITIDC